MLNSYADFEKLSIFGCEQTGEYLFSNGKLVPRLPSDDIKLSIECNKHYCRTKNIANGRKICWKCRLDVEEFVMLDAFNVDGIECKDQDFSIELLGSDNSDDFL